MVTRPVTWRQSLRRRAAATCSRAHAAAQPEQAKSKRRDRILATRGSARAPPLPESDRRQNESAPRVGYALGIAAEGYQPSTRRPPPRFECDRAPSTTRGAHAAAAWRRTTCRAVPSAPYTSSSCSRTLPHRERVALASLTMQSAASFALAQNANFYIERSDAKAPVHLPARASRNQYFSVVPHSRIESDPPLLPPAPRRRKLRRPRRIA
jgi:hypothetical protein